jgi:hypothetical protein
VAFWEKIRDGEAPEAKINKARRRLIEATEKQLAESRALGEAAERQIAAAQARFLKLTRGERAVSDDEPSARELAAAHIRDRRTGLRP